MLRAISLFVVLALVGLFALVNWPAFTAPTPLSLGITTVQAPLGLIMLALLAFLGVLFTVWVIALQATSLRDARRQNRELQAQRDLADKAEASRFTELRGDLLARLDRLQSESRVALEQQANTIAAHIGELEDRLERARLLPPPEER
ncbi:MAG: LapA family protein [Burkholderiales bacterium]|nr:LapA family protein [Burkholderiales bacterium]MDE2298188.1 LapA family protein [Burkholderiales bacterium]MDE2628276.1 LapA family protein [Burkholderiales bacterium]